MSVTFTFAAAFLHGRNEVLFAAFNNDMRKFLSIPAGEYEDPLPRLFEVVVGTLEIPDWDRETCAMLLKLRQLLNCAFKEEIRYSMGETRLSSYRKAIKSYLACLYSFEDALQ